MRLNWPMMLSDMLDDDGDCVGAGLRGRKLLVGVAMVVARPPAWRELSWVFSYQRSCG